MTTPETTETAELLELVLEATNDGIVDLNLATGQTTYNPRWKNLLGFDGNDLIESATLWRELIHPADLPELDALLIDHVEQAWPFVCTVRMRHSQGGFRSILCRGASRRDPSGRAVRMIITFADISPQVRAEEQQRALLSAIPDSMIRLRADGKILALMLGTAEDPSPLRASAVGQHLADTAVPPALIEALVAGAASGIGSGQLETFAATVPADDGTDRTPASYEIRVIRSGDDEAVCILRDLTKERAMEHRLLQARKMEAIGQLAAGVAHELNTPLQYVGDSLHFMGTSAQDLMGFIDHLHGIVTRSAADGITDEMRRDAEDKAAALDLEYLRTALPEMPARALGGIDRMSRIVAAMKAFANPGSAEMTPTDVNALVENTLIVATSEWRSMATATTRLDADLVPVPCLAGDLSQVILHLIVNAAHAIADVVGSGGELGLITVETQRFDTYAEIRVSDTGTGIPEAIRDKVFDPFFTTKEVGKGAGQGLAIAHATVVEHHHGTIHFETEAGKGTTFIVRLPLALAERSAA